MPNFADAQLSACCRMTSVSQFTWGRSGVLQRLAASALKRAAHGHPATSSSSGNNNGVTWIRHAMMLMRCSSHCRPAAACWAALTPQM